MNGKWSPLTPSPLQVPPLLLLTWTRTGTITSMRIILWIWQWHVKVNDSIHVGNYLFVGVKCTGNWNWFLIITVCFSNSFLIDSRLTECVICRKSFSHPQLLQAHLSSHLTPVTSSPLSLLSVGLTGSNNVKLSASASLGLRSSPPMSPLSSSSFTSSVSNHFGESSSPSSSSSSFPGKKPDSPFNDCSTAKGSLYNNNNDCKAEVFPCPYNCPTVFTELNGLAKHIHNYHGIIGSPNGSSNPNGLSLSMKSPPTRLYLPLSQNTWSRFH